MDGVKPLSLGRGSILCGPPVVGRIGRVRIEAQPALLIANRNRLGHRRMRSGVEHVVRQTVGTPRGPHIRFGLADRILDRKSLFSVSSGKFTFCGDWHIIVGMCHMDKYVP